MRKSLILLGIGLLTSTSGFASTPWQSDAVYNAGDVVTHNGNTFVSIHWNSGSVPVVNDVSWDGWLYVENGNISLFQAEEAYNGAELVNYKGEYYLSKWWVQGEYPNESSAWRHLVNLDLGGDVTPPVEPEPDLDPKSAEAIHGADSDNDGIRDSYKAAVIETYSSPEIVQFALSAAYEYKLLHELALDNSIQLSKEDATKQMNSFIRMGSCFEQLRREGLIQKMPNSLFTDSIYRAVYYRIGKRRLFELMDSDYDAFIFEDSPCPASLISGGQQ
ncbi:TPA: carbohydrate-binding protein [Vibrio diabolicus]